VLANRESAVEVKLLQSKAFLNYFFAGDFANFSFNFFEKESLLKHLSLKISVAVRSLINLR
jgi:hypothetical protein